MKMPAQMQIFDLPYDPAAKDGREKVLFGNGISDALDRMKCTRIVIAHRLSTIRHCDRIIVLDNGRIIEDGSYDDLIAGKGFFAELISRQRLDDSSSRVPIPSAEKAPQS